MRYRRRIDNSPRTITAKFAGKCANCGGDIPAGAMCDYHPVKRQIGHLGAFSGDGDKMGQCFAARRDAPDTDRMYEDQCAAICGR